MTTDSYSIVEYYAYQTQRECGYCNGPNTNCNHGMWAHYLTVQDYQDLIDRGWRRSGRYCYKPTMDKTCCPMYTIRCEALDFKVTKSQKKILKRMAKYLRNETQRDGEMDDSNIDTPDDADMNNIQATNYAEHLSRAKTNVTEIKRVDDGNVANRLSTENIENNREKSLKNNSTITTPACSDNENTMRKMSRDPNRPPPKKAKLARIERKHKKLLAQGKSPEEIDTVLNNKKQNVPKSVEDLFDETINGGVKTLETKVVRVMSEEFFETLDVSANLYKKYQMAIHKNQPDECDKKSFFNFLVKSPLQPYSPQDGPPQGYGSFHEQYWLNGQLIAVGVIDILPACVSSVYFFYDPDYSFLSLGTFSSLREVCLTRQLNKVASGIKYYYMGFYIHSNVKMRYKARIKPSKLLCPESYTWCDIDHSIAKLDKNKYSRLNDDLDAVDNDGFVNVEKVMVLNHHRAMKYGSYKDRNDESDELVKEYASLVGMKCAQSMLLYRN